MPHPPPLSRILMVDDDAFIRAVAKMALETLGGLTVAYYGDGQTALDEISGFAPDMVLLDMMIPGMDGPIILETMRTLPGQADTPVVFLTGSDGPPVDLLSLGAVAVMAKPFDPKTLARDLNAIWHRHHGVEPA